MFKKRLAKDTTRTVYAHNYKSTEAMIKAFKRKIQNSGILEEYKNRTFYIKPSEKKRQQLKNAKYRATQ